jgi:molecular chaperone GrpE (heat shock protein)
MHGISRQAINGGYFMENENTVQAEETSANAENTEPAEQEKSAETAAHEAEEKPEKTYTQAELDKIITKRLARERSSAEAKADKALKEIETLRNRNSCYKAGIRDDCVEDAITLAGKFVDDKTDFSTALSKVVEKYPNFKSEVSAQKITTGVKSVNSETKSDEKLRAAFGLSPKK